jgi:hypothetical protein
VTDSGCTMDGQVLVVRHMNRLQMLKLFLMKHLARLKGLKTVKQHGAPAAAVETHIVLQRWTWHLISIGMDLRETIQS